MAFRFPLAALLTLRELLERQERLALQRALTAQQTQQHRLDISTAVTYQHAEAIGQALTPGLSAASLHWSVERMKSIRRAHRDAGQLLQELTAARETQTQSYLAARRELDTVQHLQRDMFASYSAELAKREQQLIDSLHLAKLVRQTTKKRRTQANDSGQPS